MPRALTGPEGLSEKILIVLALQSVAESGCASPPAQQVQRPAATLQRPVEGQDLWRCARVLPAMLHRDDGSESPMQVVQLRWANLQSGRGDNAVAHLPPWGSHAAQGCDSGGSLHLQNVRVDRN